MKDLLSCTSWCLWISTGNLNIILCTTTELSLRRMIWCRSVLDSLCPPTAPAMQFSWCSWEQLDFGWSRQSITSCRNHTHHPKSKSSHPCTAHLRSPPCTWSNISLSKHSWTTDMVAWSGMMIPSGLSHLSRATRTWHAREMSKWEVKTNSPCLAWTRTAAHIPSTLKWWYRPANLKHLCKNYVRV